MRNPTISAKANKLYKRGLRQSKVLMICMFLLRQGSDFVRLPTPSTLPQAPVADEAAHLMTMSALGFNFLFHTSTNVGAAWNDELRSPVRTIPSPNLVFHRAAVNKRCPEVQRC
eukprot:133150-Amphidinium_carterae.1